MDVTEYQLYFDQVLNAQTHIAPYNDPDMLHYAELNKSRQDRWLKKGELSPELVERIKMINSPTHWVVITEPWCGDAAHIVPFIMKLAKLNPNIQLSFQLRDSKSEIESYLTNGSRSIPKLIVRNGRDEDLFTWGPRPKKGQELLDRLKGSGMPVAEAKTELQKWYNADKGQTFQKELLALLS